MRDLGDYDLGDALAPPPPPRGPRWAVIVVAALVLLLVGLGIYGWYSRRFRPAPQEATAPPVQQEAAEPARAPLGGPGEDIELPPLGELDPVVRQLVSRVSAHPAVAAWLTTDGLVRNATVVVQNIAAGQTPTRHLRRIAPQAGFAVRQDSGETTVDPSSYQRYDWLAEAVDSLDTDGSARLYSTLKPRVEEAYAELGSPGTRFDTTLERAIVVLLETPVVDGDVRLVSRGALYAYADPRLEALSPAQKQLLRTGPRNTRLIQSKLREIAVALGIPPDRLPPVRRM